MFAAPEEELSFVAASSESFQIQYTFDHPRIHFDHYHAEVIRKKLTQNLPKLLPDLLDELNSSLDDEFATVREGNAISFPRS